MRYATPRYIIQRQDKNGRWHIAATSQRYAVAKVMAHIASIDGALPTRIRPVANAFAHDTCAYTRPIIYSGVRVGLVNGRKQIYPIVGRR